MALDGAAQRLVTLGHDVVVHGRDQQRAQEAPRGVPGARSALAGDLASLEETRALADQANAAGPFQTVIHNAGSFVRTPRVVRRSTDSKTRLQSISSPHTCF